MTTQKSLADKMQHAYNLSIDLCYNGCDHETKCDHACTPVSKIVGLTYEQEDDVWSLADGLWHKYYHDRVSGRCSLQASIGFDVEKFEQQIDDLIKVMEGAIYGTR